MKGRHKVANSQANTKTLSTNGKASHKVGIEDDRKTKMRGFIECLRVRGYPLAFKRWGLFMMCFELVRQREAEVAEIAEADGPLGGFVI